AGLGYSRYSPEATGLLASAAASGGSINSRGLEGGLGVGELDLERQFANSVEDEEAGCLVNADPAAGDAAILEGVDDALIRVLVLLPHADIFFADADQLAGAHLFKAGKHPCRLAFSGQNHRERPLASAPAHAGEVLHGGAGFEHDGLQPELLHRLL